MRVLRLVYCLCAFAWLGVSMAQLEVDPAGGPLVLSEEVAAAFDIWQESFPAETLAEPAARIAFAGELLGPDTASLTLRYDDGRTDVLLSPARYATGPVLVHEIGVLLGLSPEGDGVMDPAIDEASPTAPTEADVAMLRDARAYPPADLTRDGVVDFYDLAAFGEAFGSVGLNIRADLNGDGSVDDADLAILREAYVFTAPSRPPPSPEELVPAPGSTPNETPNETPDETPGETPGETAPEIPAPSPEGDAPVEPEPDAGQSEGETSEGENSGQ